MVLTKEFSKDFCENAWKRSWVYFRNNCWKKSSQGFFQKLSEELLEELPERQLEKIPLQGIPEGRLRGTSLKTLGWISGMIPSGNVCDIPKRIRRETSRNSWRNFWWPFLEKFLKKPCMDSYLKNLGGNRERINGRTLN